MLFTLANHDNINPFQRFWNYFQDTDDSFDRDRDSNNHRNKKSSFFDQTFMNPFMDLNDVEKTEKANDYDMVKLNKLQQINRDKLMTSLIDGTVSVIGHYVSYVMIRKVRDDDAYKCSRSGYFTKSGYVFRTVFTTSLCIKITNLVSVILWRVYFYCEESPISLSVL